MAAAKKRMPSMIQQQIDAAKKVLAAAESKAAMSQSELQQAMANLSSIQSQVESAEVEVRESIKALKEIEEEILKTQRPNSELHQAEAALEQAKQAAHLLVHKVLNLPPDREEKPSGIARLEDLAGLSDTQRQTLEADARYQAALQKLHDSGQKVDQVRRKLFQANADWMAAQEDLADARKRLQEERQQAKAAGTNSSRGKQRIQNAQGVADAARAIILQGEVRLRLLSRMPTRRPNSPRGRR